MLKPLAYAAVAATFTVALALSAQATISGSGGSVEFTAVGPAGLKINGKSPAITESESGANVVVTVPLANLDTGIGLRNDHMKKKYLETDKYPNAVLTVAKSAVSLPNGGTGDSTGTLSMHGKQKNAPFHYTVRKEGTEYVVSGNLRVNLTDFGIEQPSFAGASVKPDVDVAVQFRSKDQ